MMDIRFYVLASIIYIYIYIWIYTLFSGCWHVLTITGHEVDIIAINSSYSTYYIAICVLMRHEAGTMKVEIDIMHERNKCIM